MKSYDHSKIEKKWQKFWDENKVYKTLDAKKATTKGIKPYYVLDMFPYPSGSGLHVGHPRGYIASDVFARMKRMQGFNVLHPMGFDSFGLPAEQYAIQTGKNPATFTEQLVKRYKTQLSILGLSYDWDRQVATHDPKYYKWTQWIFLQIYNSWYDTKKKTARPITELEKIFETKGNKSVTAWTQYASVFTAKEWNAKSEIEKQDILMNYRLAYEGYAEVNWCPELGTVLANDEVVEKNGKMVSERGEFTVEKKNMRQWFMRITAYGDRLLEGLETIDWSNSIKEIQKNWIGKSEGAEIEFEIKSNTEKYLIFDFDGVLGDTWEQTIDVCMEISGSDRDTVIAQTKAYFSKKPIHTRDGHVDDIKGHDTFIYDFDNRMKSRKFELFTDFIKEIAKIHNAKIAIVSSGTTGYITPKIQQIKQFGIHPTHVMTYEDHHSKEEKIEHICRDWKVNVSDIYYFTDAKADVYELETICDKAKLIGCGWGFLGTESLCEVLPKNQVLVNYTDIHNLFSTLENKVSVFTTRPDTLFGVTYVVLAPEHRLIQELKSNIKNWKEVEQYIVDTKRKDDITRTANEKDKTGVRLDGIFAINPANGESVPVWIADYVLVNYGTGAVMAVPAHDERDFEFANNYNLDIKQVISPVDSFKSIAVATTLQDPELFKRQLQENSISFELATSTISGREHIRVSFSKDKLKTFIKLVQDQITGTNWVEVLGTETVVIQKGNVHYGLLDDVDKWFKKFSDWEPFVREQKNLWDMLGKNQFLREFVCYTDEGVLKHSGKFDGITSSEAKKKITEHVNGKWVTKYKFRDAIFARQRYWGEPIPLVHTKDGTIKTVSEKQLPLELPKVKSYAPAGDGQSPLATVKSWVTAGYETNTMPGWAGSSWYFLRYTDPKNKKKFADATELDYWFGKNGGVNMYVGGAEHSTGHLLYSRFWHKVLHDLGHVKSEEPFMKLRNQGMIGGADGRKMSKRWGNVVNPDDVVKQFGADTLRVYETFVGPFESDLPWSTDGIVGSRRFVERIWRFQEKVSDTKKTPIELQKSLHKTIKKVTDDIATFSFNTAISAMMIFANELEKHESINVKDFKKFIQILAPFAPYMTDELWNSLGEKKSIHCASWPIYDPKLIVDDTFTIGIQINGKVRAEITISKDINQSELEEKVYVMDDVVKWIDGKTVKKFIYVPGRIINIVI